MGHSTFKYVHSTSVVYMITTRAWHNVSRPYYVGITSLLRWNTIRPKSTSCWKSNLSGWVEIHYFRSDSRDHFVLKLNSLQIIVEATLKKWFGSIFESGFDYFKREVFSISLSKKKTRFFILLILLLKYSNTNPLHSERWNYVLNINVAPTMFDIVTIRERHYKSTCYCSSCYILLYRV